MRFTKEYVIIFVILMIVFFTNYITEKSLKESVDWMRDKISSIENKMDEKNEKEAQDEFDELQDGWMGRSDTLSLFVEHNELEKISDGVMVLDSNFKTNDVDRIMENISELKFLLEHIQEKNQLKLKNIF